MHACHHCGSLNIYLLSLLYGRDIHGCRSMTTDFKYSCYVTGRKIAVEQCHKIPYKIEYYCFEISAESLVVMCVILLRRLADAYVCGSVARATSLSGMRIIIQRAAL